MVCNAAPQKKKNLADPYGYILFTFFQKAKTLFGFLSVIENRC